MDYETAFQQGYEDGYKGSCDNPYDPGTEAFNGYSLGNDCGFEDLVIERAGY